ncbi:TlpA disulfide reductase family protein [uncultured Polaribacter sp.]|uniref:TlpA family protein disulfide reductase n=1 Tax=uncultured Polaribacter sp. TaxID=174711 RepID=UPI00262CBEB0|nr:TlpA disulfide reductase family protein [uncultured Polaribacter sp.]
MKKAIYFVILITLIVACKDSVKDYVVLSGQIKNSTSNELILNLSIANRDTITIDNNGKFFDTIQHIKEARYYLYDGKNYLRVYLENGKDVHVYYDAKNVKETLMFSGAGAGVNNYFMNKEAIEKKRIQKDTPKATDIYKLDEATYKMKLKQVKKAQEDLLLSSAEVSEAFKVKEKKNIIYQYLEDLSSYQEMHAYFTKKPNFKVSDSFLNELNEVSYDNEKDFKSSPAYARLIRHHYNREAEALAESEKIAEDIAYLKVMERVNNKTIKNSLLFEKAKSSITYANNLEAYYNAFITASSNKAHMEEIKEIYSKLKIASDGQPSPKFINYENYAGGTTSLDDFKGKYVYIDVWATWCGPCLYELPYLKKIEKAYHDKNIEFVSISIDESKNHDKWKTMVKNKQMGGVQLFADKAWKSQFVKDYVIKGIPKFILIDPKGQIIKANAPRPSSEKLLELLSNYNI